MLRSTMIFPIYIFLYSARVSHSIDLQVRCTKFESDPGQYTLYKIQDYMWSVMSIYLTLIDYITHQYKHLPVTVSLKWNIWLEFNVIFSFVCKCAPRAWNFNCIFRQEFRVLVLVCVKGFRTRFQQDLCRRNWVSNCTVHSVEKISSLLMKISVSWQVQFLLLYYVCLK